MATTTDLIQQLYVAYFNRPADVSGLAFWVNAYDNGGASLDTISKNFNTAAEYTAAYAGKSPDAIVNTVYQNLFGRNADSEGLNFWSPKIQSGAITTADLVKAISAGAKNADGTANADGLVLANKVAAAEAFTTELATPGNEAERVAYSTGTAAVLTAAKNFIAGVTTDATLATAVAGVHAAAQNLVVLTTPSTTYTLTTGIDTGINFIGGAGNDIFDATKGASAAATLNALDSIDGGAGSDTLNVAQTAAVALTGSTVVKNIEHASLVSGGTVSANTAGWTGLTDLTVASAGGEAITLIGTSSLVATDSALAAGTIVVDGGTSVNVTAAGSTTGTITVGATTAATGAVSISNTTTGAVAAGTITVNGGSTVTINQAASNAVNTTQTNGAVVVTGTAATTAVTANAAVVATASATVAGVTANSVSITDVNAGSATKGGTIATISLDSYTTAAIADTGLTTLNLGHGSGNVIIDNSGLTTATNKTLNLGLNGVTGGTLDDADIYTTLNVTTSGANSTVANVTFGGVTALNVAGSKVVTLTSAAGLSALATVAVSGSAGLTADLSAATVTSVSTAATTGKSTVTVDASKATFTGGAGVDVVTTSAAVVGKAIDLGAGDDTLVLTNGTLPTATVKGGAGTDTLSMVAADAVTASGSAAFAGQVTGFEALTLTGATGAQTVDLAVLGNYTAVTSAASAGTLTLNNLASNGSLTITGDTAGTGYVVGVTGAATGLADVLNLNLTKAGLLAAGSVTAANVETVNIVTSDTQTTPTNPLDTLTLVATSATTVKVSGNAGLNLTGTADVALTSLDASGITAGSFTFTSGALAGAASIKGSATGTNTVTFSAAVNGAVTYTGGTGADVITASNGKNNIINLGNGTNSVTGTTGNQTITGGTGADTVTLTTGNNVVNLGNGANTFTATSGNNTYVGGTGVDTVTVGGGLNTITTGTGADVVTITAAGANVNTYTTITDAHAGMQIAFGNLGTETFTSAKISSLDPSTAVFQDYANAVVAGASAADHSTNGAFGWFQFGGNTYLVEVRHDTTGGIAQTFVNGTDMIVKLTGLIDLSTATGGTTNVLTLV